MFSKSINTYKNNKNDCQNKSKYFSLAFSPIYNSFWLSIGYNSHLLVLVGCILTWEQLLLLCRNRSILIMLQIRATFRLLLIRVICWLNRHSLINTFWKRLWNHRAFSFDWVKLFIRLYLIIISILRYMRTSHRILRSWWLSYFPWLTSIILRWFFWNVLRISVVLFCWRNSQILFKLFLLVCVLTRSVYCVIVILVVCHIF